MSEREKPPSSPPSLPRTLTPQKPIAAARPTVHPIGTPRAISPTSGSLAVAAWLAARGIFPPIGRTWRVHVGLETIERAASFGLAATRFELTIDPETWRYLFAHDNRTSTIQVASLPNAVDRDEHRLTALTPGLKNLGLFMRDLEARYHIFFRRNHAAIRTDLPGSEPFIRAWISSL